MRGILMTLVVLAGILAWHRGPAPLLAEGDKKTAPVDSKADPKAAARPAAAAAAAPVPVPAQNGKRPNA